MDISDLKIGLLAPGEFRRLAPHAGFLGAWYEVLPPPARIAAGSAAAISSVVMAPGTAVNTRFVHQSIRELRASNIFSIPMETKASGSLALLTATFPLLTHIEPEMRPAWRILLHVLQTAFAIGLGVRVVKQMFNAPAVFSNEPLERFLTERLGHNFEEICQANTEIRIMLTDVETGEHVAYSTKERGMTLSRLVSLLLASATIPISFPIRVIDGRAFTDAEVKTNYPISQLEDMDIVFELFYSDAMDARVPQKTWGDHQSGMWNIAKQENNYHSRERYERRRLLDSRLPEVVRIRTHRHIPPLQIDDFNQAALERSIQLGELIFRENLDVIGNSLGKALREKETRIS